MDLNYFDCNCMLGPRSDGKPGEPSSQVQLLENMEYFGIQEALVTSATSRDYSVQEGNRELAKALVDHSQLSMVWTLDYLPCIREPHPSMTIIDDFDAKAVVAYPKRHKYSLAPWSLGNWLSIQESRKLPLLIPRDQTEWDEVQKLCHDYPELPIIITRVGYRELNYLYPIWKLYKNLFIDISWLSIHRGLEFIADSGFATQLIFGTYYPYYTPGGALGILDYAQLDMSHKNKIASETLAGLIFPGQRS